MKNLALLLAGVAIISFSGCDDNDDNVNKVEPQASRAEIITAADWVMVSAVETENGQSVDLFAAQKETAKDDIFRFGADGVAVREEGATREVNKPDQVDKGTWMLQDEEKNLKVDLTTLPVDAQIVEIDRDRIVVRRAQHESVTLTVFQAM